MDSKVLKILAMHNESLARLSSSIIEIVESVRTLNEKVRRLERQTSIKLIKQDTTGTKKLGDIDETGDIQTDK